MPRDYRLYLDDILESCRKIRQFTEGASFQEFKQNIMMQDAVIRNFEIIGEAVKHLPEEIKSLYHDIQLAEITGFRNILAHGYFVVKLETVWSAIEEGLPDLEEQTKAVLGEES
ncbi:MAG: DUF86 domain-containing protein [Thermodesulfobacteriota bacterium]